MGDKSITSLYDQLKAIMSTPEGHAICAPSAAKRWGMKTGCKASIKYQGSTESKESKKGTELHEDMRNILLKDKRSAEKYISDLPGADMALINICYDEVEKLRFQYPSSKEYVENKFFLNPILHGQIDLLRHDSVCCYIRDWKFGVGEVKAETAIQLWLYAYIAGKSLSLERCRFNLGIVQPKLSAEPSIVETTWDEIVDTVRPYILFVKAVTEQAKKITDIADLDLPYNPSKENCHWCPGAKAGCTAKFGYVANEIIPAPVRSLFTVDAIKQRVKELPKEDVIKLFLNMEMIDALKAAVIENLNERANRREELPGVVLVETNGRRSLKDERVVVPILKKLGLKDDQIYQRSLNGLTTLEKLIPKKHVAKICNPGKKGFRLVADDGKTKTLSEDSILDEIEAF